VNRTPGQSRHGRRHEGAARIGYLACAAVLLGSVVLLAVDPGRGAIGIWAGAAAVVCGLGCRIYLSRGRS
jgi:hypothetical protein